MEEEGEKKADVEEAPQSPDKKIPLSLSLSLGPPNLSSAFDFPTHTNPNSTPFPNPQSSSSASRQSPRSDFDSGDLDRSDRGDDGETDDDDLVQTKKQNTVWTLELHTKFVEAVEYLGGKDATPKAIRQRMNVEGLTRESVASHLQKYRQYLRKSARNSTTDRQCTTIPLPFGPALAPSGYNVASPLPLMSHNVVLHQHQQQLLQQQYHLRPIGGNVGALHPGYLDTTPPNVDEKSEEGSGEIKELPLSPTGKD